MASLDRFKLSSVSWDSDQNPCGFLSFMFVFSSMVRALDHGNDLEDYLDLKLGRAAHQSVTTPGFLSEDPEFVRPVSVVQGRPSPAKSGRSTRDPAKSGKSGDTDAEAFMQEGEEIVHGTTYVPTPSSSTGSATSALRQTGRNYFDLHPAALALDGQLYNVLRMAIKGGKTILLECVQFPSYIQAICVLYRHSDISRNDRIAHAFEGMDSLVFNGDILKWQSDAVRKFRELFDSGASIMHYGLSRVMKSFNGKLKTIQYKIAQDLNSREIDEHTNVFDMIQEYAAAVASVGDSAHTGAEKNAAVNDERCGYCHNIGHTEAVCRKKQATKAKSGKGGGKSSAATDNRDYSNYECHFCHQKGHISRNCPEKAKTAAAAAPSPASVAAV